MAENATDDETIVHLTQRVNELEKEKRDAQAMLYMLEDDAEEREAIEKELQRFEKWVASVQPSLTDPSYVATANYTELRMAVRILGIRVTVYPTIGEYPFRYQVDITVPGLLAKTTIVGRSSPGSPERTDARTAGLLPVGNPRLHEGR